MLHNKIDSVNLIEQGGLLALSLVENGVMMHHKENKFATGMNTAILQLRKVTFDVQFDANRFRP